MLPLILVIIYTIVGNCESISSAMSPSFPARAPSGEAFSGPAYDSPVPATPSHPGPSSFSYPAAPVSPSLPIPDSPAPAPAYPPIDALAPGSCPPEPASPSPNPSNQDDGSQGVKAAYWPSFDGLDASTIETSYFTHIYYAFLLPEPATLKLNVTPFDQEKIPEFMDALRAKNPPVKTLLSIGGAGNDPTVFSKIATTNETRAIFINSSIEVARKYGLDGLDLDWEWPANDQDMLNLGLLYRQWRIALDQEAITSGKSRLLLTSAVYFSPKFLFGEPSSYPADAINRYVDWVNPMCYDYHGSWENFTGPNSALYDTNSNISTHFGIGSWIQVGVSPNKLVMGLPLYGRTWKLQDPNVNGIGARAVGKGPGDGILNYNQILEFNNENKAIVHFDGDFVFYYSYAGDSWIGYDDIMSVDLKIQFARSRGLGGYFFWALGQDKDWTISRLGKINFTLLLPVLSLF